MASVNPLSRELVFKIVYYGPGLGGKTTTLEHIHATAKPDHRGKLVSLATPVDRTLYFDFLPMRLPPIRGMHVRLQLFTVPGQVYFNATRKLVLTGADGIVFVADSQTARADANLESLDNLRDNLADQGRNLSDVPLVFQYNKHDLPDVLSVAELDKLINRWNAPSLATSARTGLGVYESLERITHAVLASFETQMPESVRVSAAAAFDPNEEGLAAALRGASQGEDRPPTSAAIFNRIASTRVTVGSIPPDTGMEEGPPIDKVAMRAAALPVTTFPEVPDDGWGTKEKLTVAPASDASILTRSDSVRAHSARSPESRSTESTRSRNRPSVLPPKPFAPLIPHAAPPRTPAAHAPAPPPNATTSTAKDHASTHAPTAPANATTSAPAVTTPPVVAAAPVVTPSVVASAPAKAFASVDKAPSTEKTVAIQASATTPAPIRAEVVAAKPQTTPVKIEVAPVKPEATPVKIEVAPVKPEAPPVKIEVAPVKPEAPPVKIETAPAKPEAAPVKIETAPVKPEAAPVKIDVAPAKPEAAPVKIEVAPVKPEAAPVKIEVAPAKPAPDKPTVASPVAAGPQQPAPFERLDPTQLLSIADLLEPPSEATRQPQSAPKAPASEVSPLSPLADVQRLAAVHQADTAIVAKRVATEPEPAPKVESPTLADLLPLPLRPSSAPPAPPSAPLTPVAAMASAPITEKLTARPATTSQAPAESVKVDAPPPPPPPPPRPIGAIAATPEPSHSEAFAPNPSSSKDSPETHPTAGSPASIEKAEARKSTGLSFSELWPEADRALVHDVETAIATGRCSEAIGFADTLVSRVLTSTATLFGSTDTIRDAASMLLLLGIDGRRYLAFRSIVRASRSGAAASTQDALAAYAFAIEARMAKGSVR